MLITLTYLGSGWSTVLFLSIHFLPLNWLLNWSLSQLSQSKRQGTPWKGHQSVTGLTYSDRQPFTPAFTPTGNLELPVNLLTLNNRALLQDLATPVPHFYQHYFGLYWKNMIFSCVALVSYIKLPVFLSFPLMTALFPPQMLLPEAAHHWPNLNKVINLLSCMFTESLFGFDGIPQGHNSRHLNFKSLIK